MYSLEDIERVGLIHIAGGIITLVVGIVTTVMLPGMDTFSAFSANLITFALFGFGWYILSQFAVASLYSNLIKGNNYKGIALERLDAPPTAPPQRFGLSYTMVEYIVIGVSAIATVIVTLLTSPQTSISLGGFLGGWLVGGGFGRVRFSNKVGEQELKLKRRFFFSETLDGPRTDAAYYSREPEPEATPPKPLKVDENLTNVPPKPPRPSSNNPRPKAQPLVSPTQRQRKKK